MIGRGTWLPLFLGLVLVGSCEEEARPADGPGRPARPAPPAAAEQVSRGALLHDADRRVLTARLREAVRSHDVERRRTAVLAVARLHDPAAAEILTAALRDPDPSVRSAASLGLAGLGPTEEGAGSVLTALAAETVARVRGDLLWDLGRIGDETAFPALRSELSSEAAETRSGACRGLAALGLRDQRVPGKLQERVAHRAVDDPALSVRRACAFALSRIEPSGGAAIADPVVSALVRAAEDPDPEVRTMAVRALGRHPGSPVGVLARRTEDRDWRVAVHAFRGLAQRVGGRSDGPYASALRGALDRATAEESGPAGPALHVLLAGLAGASGFAGKAATYGVAQEALERLGAGPAGRDRGLAHCGAAKLVDLGRKWPARLEGCGLGHVADWERQVAMAEVVAEVSGATAERGAYLLRLFRSAKDARVREAVMRAVARVGEPRELLVLGLQSRDPGIVTEAAEAARRLAGRIGDDATVAEALRAGGRVLREGDEVEGLQSWLGALGALGVQEEVDTLVDLARHPNRAVREAGRAVLEARGEGAPDAGPRPVPNPLPPQGFPRRDEELRARLETDRGGIELELWPDRAPGTVARFVELARDGFYDGLGFHRVVPGFVIQGGDPRGDGYGGPGWTQRCEDHRGAYERGTVGMALAGRDTGGSQFFITYGMQPHLEAQYTAFGRVRKGRQALEALQVGDRIRSVRIVAVSRETDQARAP